MRIPISVLMCVYNGDTSSWLDQSIMSILTQSFGQLEFIIIDDCSTDSSKRVIQRYAKRDARIKYHTTPENMGLTKALNYGLNLCEGQNIARQDADDISHPLRLEKQFGFIEKNNNVGVVGTYYDIVDKNGVWKETKRLIPSTMPLSKMNGIFAGGSAMIRWEVIQELDGYNEEMKYAQDFDMWVRVIKNGWRIETVEDVLYYWRTHDNQIGTRLLSDQQKYRWKVIEKYKL